MTTLSRRSLLLALAGVCATSMATAGPSAAKPAPEVTEFLLASAAKDFRLPGSARPTAIQSARIGTLRQASGREVHLLCGKFRSSEPSEAKRWVPFATIQTVDYEQWLGNQAESYCRQPGIKWYPGDHSESLQQRIQAQ